MSNADQPALRWVKIGEVTISPSLFVSGLYARYAVMELIKIDGMREYKRILMYTTIHSSDITQIKSQLEPPPTT